MSRSETIGSPLRRTTQTAPAGCSHAFNVCETLEIPGVLAPDKEGVGTGRRPGEDLRTQPPRSLPPELVVRQVHERDPHAGFDPQLVEP